MTTTKKAAEKSFTEARAEALGTIKTRNNAIALAELRVRNLKDVADQADEKVREWATRAAKDAALIGYDLDAYQADLMAAAQAASDAARAVVEAARLRHEERIDPNASAAAAAEAVR